MKKLVSLVLVLGLVSLAPAGLRTLQFEKGGNSVGIHSDDSDGYNVMLMYTPTLTGTVILTPMAAAGDLSYIVDYGVVDSADMELPLGLVHAWEINVASSQKGVLQPGIGCVATFDGVKLGDVDMGLGRIDLVDGSSPTDGGSPTIFGTAFVIPEPASMLLLGLGGLFLRRK